MKKLYAWTENDGTNQTLKAPPARSYDTHLDLRLETLETSGVADWKSELRAALAPPVYSNVSDERPLPPRRRRIPVIFLGALSQEKNSRFRSGVALSPLPGKS